MESKLKNIFNIKESKENVDSCNIYKLILISLTTLTCLIVILLYYLLDKPLNGILTFLLVAGASGAVGAAIGFLFGLPRAEKFRYVKKDKNEENKDVDYSDNTNLEEVSDWLTKIIVGITLIKLKTILGWIDNAASSIQIVFDEIDFNHAYVFGYCTIVLYFLVGGWLCYLWARNDLSIIFSKTRRKLEELQQRNKEAKKDIQALSNPQLQIDNNRYNPANLEMEPLKFIDSNKLVEDKIYPSEDFKNQIENIYNSKPVIDKTDLQKGRWGSVSKNGSYTLEAKYVNDNSSKSVCTVQLTVRSLNADTPLTGQVAFFLHDTFPKEIVYRVANNNIAELTIRAYEAFVAGVRLENGIELELDLNKIKGFPEEFYWI